MEKKVSIENKLVEQNETMDSLSSSSSSQLSSPPAGSDRQEIEWQYEAPEGLQKVEEWLGGCSSSTEKAEEYNFVVSEGSTKQFTDTYYDTEDWRLYHAGYALRLRKGASGQDSEATMKSLTSEDSAKSNLRRRREISEPLKGKGVDALDKSEGPISERLKALVGNRKLRPIFEIRTHRRVFDLLNKRQSVEERFAGDQADNEGFSREIVQDASGDIRRATEDSRVAEVVLDSSEIPLGDSDEVTRLTRVEVEVDPSTGVSRGLERFVKAMEERLPLRPTKISKYEAGLFTTGQSPEGSSDLGPKIVDASLSVGEVAYAVLRRQFAEMRDREPGVRLGEDPEELHDMRVAMRRMRAAIKLFQDALPERALWFRDELKFFAGVLGDVRDLDVQIEQLKELASQTDEEERQQLLPIVDAVEVQRSEARAHLLETLDSTRYERLETSLSDMLRRGPSVETTPNQKSKNHSVASAPILKIAPDILSQPYRKWRKALNSIDSTSHPEEYHELRKKGKRLRYALEFLSGVYGKKITDELVKPLKTLQDVLGNHQDSIVAADLLEEFALSSQEFSRRTVFAMGALAERYRREAEDIRRSLAASSAYRVLTKGKKWKDFEKVMKKRRREAKSV